MGLLGPSMLSAAEPPKLLPLFHSKPALIELDTRFYPLGWSDDGDKLAYLSILPWEATDTPTFSCQIVNLRTDKILYEKRWEELSATEIDVDDREAGFAAFWKLNEASINELLKKHKIVRSEFALETFPGFYGERRRGLLSVSMNKKRAKHPLGHIGGTEGGVKDFSIELTQDGVSKSVYDTRESKAEKETVYPLDVHIRGYLANETEDRIAILVVFAEAGWEGPPHTRVVKVIGAAMGEKF